MILSLYSGGLHIWSALSSSGLPGMRERDMELLHPVQQMTMKFIKEWECLSYEVRLRKLVFFSLEKRSLRENLINVYAHILKYRKFPLNVIILW